jgi:cation diffusion facilitator CzcD-associated flavoprotein CzcO
MYIDEEVKEQFKDEGVYLTYRKKLEDGFWRTYEAQIAGSDASKAMPAKLTGLMKERLGGGDNPPLLDELLPDFPPHCRRLTPGPGYLESLLKDNVELIRTPISHFTEEGIVTKDGTHRKVDAIICSTGANTDCAPPVPIVSGDIDLSRDWKPIQTEPNSKYGFPYSYLGLGVPGFPNMSFILGPNPAGPTGTLVNSAETQIAYIAKMLRKMSSQGIKTMAPSKGAADDFVEYCDAFFPRTNLTKKCSSWSNSGIPGNRIHGHWPGSAAHLNEVRREPRYGYC